MDVISAKPDPLANWDSLPLSHARILYENKLMTSNVTDAEKALVPNTYERWTDASGTMEARFQPGSSVKANAIGIAAHNLGSAGSTIIVSTAPTVSGTFTERGAITPTTNEPILFLFDTVDDVEDVKITITGGVDREVGVVYSGEVLTMYQPIYGGHNPIDLMLDTDYRNTRSESGQFLGRDIIRRGTRASYKWKHLDPDWVRDRFKPFIESALTKPFFIKWRPDLYETTAFGFTEKDVRLSNMGGGHRLMDASFNMRGHGDL